ncbi:M14 family zinc carboxypeptidase [Marinobacterium rhizophilum]|uniref:DUF2817 domain-containing protein n=1 Tax=Marinobacterium rhizophilum TaxID=420402 RepID=A0ABY5HKR9_9GAMM|nr:M14 family zinc carboxypeptidase [Marinobacterium rhizophilum]UTW12991.1 DUF2817 domain-containing protein [Marinobacterium rhizophilum]
MKSSHATPGTTASPETCPAARRHSPQPRPDLPELDRLERLLAQASGELRVQVLANVTDGASEYPLYALQLGNPDPAAAVLLLSGGIHGVERIGTQLLLTQLEALMARLPWDQGLQEDLRHIRIVICPLLNPAGMARGSRANANGIDLMRNAPQNADDPGVWLLSGHRIGAWLPWYRGAPGLPMQAESAALCELVNREIAGAPLCLSLDCHSGFGMRDRLWFPYAGSTRPLEQLADVHALVKLYEEANPHHRYLFEPQCHQYRTHGDLWDHLYQQHLLRQQACPGRPAVFLPLTLELGSWLWVRKNLRQIISFRGLFNPLVPHRHRRIMRHHNSLFDFMIRATRSWQSWLPGEADRNTEQQQALQRWYRNSQ